MKDLKQFILEFKERKVKSFDYKLLKDKIENCKPKFFGNSVFIDILWAPEIYFHYSNGWSADKPRNNGEDKKYNDISLGASTIMCVDFYATKNLFKENDLSGRISCFAPSIINDEDNDNWDAVKEYLKSKFNAKDISGCDYIAFKTYGELEEILKELESVINKYNTKFEKNSPAYLYFDKSEAEQNSADKKKQYEITTCEEEIVKLNKYLEDVKKAASASDTDLTTLIDATKEKIEYFKKKKENIK